MTQIERMHQVAEVLAQEGHGLRNQLVQVLSEYGVHDCSQRDSEPWDPWDLEWADAARQARWDRLRQHWNAFAVHIMAETSGVPVAPTTVRALVDAADADVRRVAGAIRERVITEQLTALGIAPPAEAAHESAE